jgi:PhnB protein
MTTLTPRRTAEAQIRALIDNRVEGFRAKDAAAIVADYAPHNVMYVLAPPLQSVSGASPGKKGIEDWLATFKGTMDYEVRDLSITAGEDVAFAYSLHHLMAKQLDGKKVDMWFRSTLCFEKYGGEWKIAHEHESVPFYMDGSLKAAVDLKP